MSCATALLDQLMDIQTDTIIPGNTSIPFTCDHCATDTEIALEKVIVGQKIICCNCATARTILPAEVQVTRQLLNQFGFYYR